MLPRAVQRLAAALGSAVVLVGLTWITASGQGTTGKIQGRVTNAQTGQPIAAAQVTVEGTTLGNITNDDGYYFVNEVPAGVFSFRAQSIGYRASILRLQRVLAGQTTTLNFTLEQTAVELEALVVTGERNPLVPRDQVSSKSIVTGETIDAMPMDQASSIIVLQPGVITTNSGRSIRGSREGEEAVYIDGVPIRRMRTGAVETTELSTNVLAQVDVVTGGIGARYGDAQSGMINYVTRTGGPTFGGTAAFMTDQTVTNWSNGFNRAELSLGGPIPGVNNLTFFVGGTAEGQSYSSTYQGMVNSPGFWYATGVDTTFRLPRTSAVSGLSDSVDVAVPNYVKWDNGNRYPTGQSDEYNLTAKLTYGLPRGGKVDLTWYRNRDQSIGGSFYNPDGGDADFSTSNVVTLGTYFLLAQSAEGQLAFDLKGSYQQDWAQQGDVTAKWRHDHRSPFLGFNFGNADFIMDPDDWPVSEKLVQVIKSGLLPPDSLNILPRRADLGTRTSPQGFTGDALRLNPYAIRGGYSMSGTGNANQAYQAETRLYLSGTMDWQLNRYNRLWLGGDITKAKTETQSVPLYTGNPGTSIGLFEPTRAGLYVQNRLDIGDVVLEGGLRYEYFQPDGDWPRIPGYVFNVPDSLRADFYTIEQGAGGFLDRTVPLADCGGDATAARRRNPVTGQLVCKNNFIQTEAKTTWSPRLAVSFPVTATSTFRFSYSHNTQVPALTVEGGLVDAIYADLKGGSANTNTTFGRDVDIPRTVLFEAGYRQVFGGNTVIDASAYSKTTRNALTYRKIQYRDPVSGGSTYINSLTNADYSLARGVDLRFDRRFSEIADLSLNYSFVNAQGTGSDPNTYTGLILRRNTNLSVLTGNPVDPPELLLTLNQSRAHNLSSTLSLLFPADYREGSAAGTILGDLGMFATMRFASGLPYTRLLNNGDGQVGPPTAAGLGGIPAEQLNASRTPSTMNIDMRLVRGFRVGANRMRLTADFRNPFHIANTTSVWLETGTTINTVHREEAIDALLRDNVLDGDTNIDDFRIMTESPDHALNKYMLAQAEARFGNGDGMFTVEEQRAAFLAEYLWSGNNPLRFRRADRSLRLGVEFIF